MIQLFVAIGIFFLITLPLIGIIQRIAKACGTSWFRVALSIFCWVVGGGIYIYVMLRVKFNIISVKSFLIIALIVASPWIIIFAWKTMVIFYGWAMEGITNPDD